jgi:protein-disulfide isomerase
VKSASMWAVLLTAFAMPVAAPAIRPAPLAAVRNWLKVSARTPDGAIVVGNPAAKVKVIEYLSLTCPHCALMAGQSMGPLKRDYIAKGLVSFEVRHAVRDGYDFVGSLLVRCQPATDYLDAMELLFATQESWMAKAVAAKDDAAFERLNPDQKMVSVARSAGFDSVFAKRGMTSQRFGACMANKTAKLQLGAMADKAWNADKIPGTPAFVINGTVQDSVSSWAELEKQIRAAL